ncbi:Ubiquitin-conjugating enzyme E2 Q2 [Tritrichomonas foetus]|uniref:Ubiquitin-conjugating enzyme E2 Q2 n=1 Tax=Tritrichomonas foetus TaxID=1144522 RepID=A0A1J4K8G7_9EUKA|nr:Ubiquitin-conjugating enzyme E2 Q2 [Tritrichomonas foetus]|eukprot:OHT07266.1 Ubiquitin-conjugating enzyme E2 Q2 [Tritrichomonas foetus]
MSNEEEDFGNNEEEDFGNDEEVIIDDDDEDEIELDESFELPPRADTPEESEDNVMEDLVQRFNPKTGAAKRLLSDLREMMKNDPKELGFSTEPMNNDIFNWEVRLFGFEKGTDIEKDMIKYKQKTGRDYIKMVVTFPPDYPNLPPFVRVVEPRFMFRTGRITTGGSLCTDVLTMESWNPMYDICSLMINISAEIMDGKPRVDFSNPTPYSLEEARAAYFRVASDHGWKVSKWVPTK